METTAAEQAQTLCKEQVGLSLLYVRLRLLPIAKTCRSPESGHETNEIIYPDLDCNSSYFYLLPMMPWIIASEQAVRPV